MRLTPAVLRVAICLLTGTLAAQVAPPPLTPEEIRQGFSNRTFLAKPLATTAPEELAAAESLSGLRLRRAYSDRRNLRVLEAATGESVPQSIERLRATGRYEFVEPDYIVKADVSPNDPRYLAGEQWALRNTGQSAGKSGADIRAEEAWSIQSGAPNVVVAVIDSGFRLTHEDLAPNLWTNPDETGSGRDTNRFDDDSNGYIDDVNGINSLFPKNTFGGGYPIDSVGHGTAVASVIGASGNNALGMTGVAWNVSLMSLRFLDSTGYGLVSDEIECIDYAIAKKAALINASFGGSAYSQSLFDALKRARDAGIVVVCSAGNDAENNDLSPHYPSGYLLDNIVSVANTTRTDTLAASSDYGSGLIELAAPGTSILTASAGGDNLYQTLSGTSFSAPMVTGALALLKAKFPTDNYRETINRLLRGVDVLPALAGKTATSGRLNVAAALRTTTTRPYNDDFAQRGLLTGELITARGASQSSTREVGESVHAGTAGNGSLWWSWTAPRTGSVTIDTTGSATDTLLQIYTGTAVASLVSVASNDNESDALTTSKVTFNATAGTAYQIAVDNKSTTVSGLVLVRISLLASNDNFDSAQTVSGRSWNVSSENRTATRETGEPRIKNNAGGHSVWHRWVAPATRRYHLSTFSSDFNTMLGVFTGTTLSSLAEINSSTTDGDTNYTASSAGVTFTATAGTTYYIVVDSEVSSTGTSAVGAYRLSCIDSEWESMSNGGLTTLAIAADGTLHGTDRFGDVYALNPDGSRKWRYTMTGYGTYSAPAVDSEGTVYGGDDYNYFHAITATGTRKWRILTQGIIQSSPALGTDGTIYIRSDDGKLYALNPADGSTKWTVTIGTSTAGTSYSSPVVAPDGTIYCAGASSRLYAITPAGVTKWTFQTDFIYSSPAIAADGTIYLGVSAPTRRMYALRPDGTTKWEYIVNDSVSSSAAIGADGTVYFGCVDKNVYALTANGELRWTYATGGAIRNSSPTIASDGSIYIGSTDGKLYCIEPEGTLRRAFATANEVRSSPIIQNGRLYLSSWDYRLYAVEIGQVTASTPWPMHRQNIRRSARVQSPVLAFGVQPVAQTAAVEEKVTFTAGAVGTAPLSYQWLFAGQTIAGATAATYRIDSVNHVNGGAYSVRVTDSTGSITSNNATLTLSTPLVLPTVATAPAPQTTLAGTGVTLSVTAAGSAPFAYQWLREGQPIAGATASTLVLTSLRPSDSGKYTVKITNFGGSTTSDAATVTVNPISRISNLSVLTSLSAPADNFTLGYVVGGNATTGTKPLVLRAAGPSLGALGVGGTLDDPKLETFTGTTKTGENDNWGGSAALTTAISAVGAFPYTSPTSKDAATTAGITTRDNSVKITAANDGVGLVIAEIYDATTNDSFTVTTPRLLNVSVLKSLGTGLTVGFTIAGSTPKTVLIRAIGPTLGGFGVPGTVEDPQLTLFNSASVKIAENDNWGGTTALTAAFSSVGAFALPATSKDAALLTPLPPGGYSVKVSGVNDTTGAALVEVYEVP